MNKSTANWMIVAGALILAGGIAFGALMSALQWDFSKLSTGKMVTNELEITEEFRDISILTDTADITFIYSEDSKTTVLCREQEDVMHKISVQNGTLRIQAEDARPWYAYIGFNFHCPSITVTLPKASWGVLSVCTSTGDTVIPKEFDFESMAVTASTGDIRCSASVSGDVKLKASTGDILVEDADFGNTELSVSTGRVTVHNLSCKGNLNIQVSTGKTAVADTTCAGLTSRGNTGDIRLENTRVAGALDIKRTTGDVTFDRADAYSLTVKTSTGDVEGSLLSGKVFVTQTSTGKIRVPQSSGEAICRITTSTGNVTVTVAPRK